MFEFGKDLRRIFSQACHGEDRTWLELIGADLLEAEAQQQAIEAGRVSCRRPLDAWLRASVLWLEHARRTGQRQSLEQAMECADEARRTTRHDAGRLEADLAMASARLVHYELRGEAEALDQALALVETQPDRIRPVTAARIAAIHAVARSRRARRDGTDAGRKDAAALLDQALHGLISHATLVVERSEVQLERAALTLETGVTQRSPALLDQAGRDLRALVAECGADDRPITRARALVLCAAGLSTLATLAKDANAARQAAEMFDAAAETFTPDHSPLDWIAVMLARAHRMPPADGELQMARRLTLGQGLILGALTLERQLSQAISAAETRRDTRRLLSLEAECHGRLRTQKAHEAPLDWVVEQIAIAQTRLARGHCDAAPCQGLVMALMEAAEVARDHGCVDLSVKAAALNAAVLSAARSA